MIIIVLGMHRSGTSALSGMLHNGGIFMGEDSWQGDSYNLKGYFEAHEMYEINEKILNFLKVSWCDIPDQLNFDNLPESITREIELLYKKYKEKNEIWGWKDPRLCITFPVWYKVIRQEKIVVLYSKREPMATAQSLLKRDGFPLKKGLRLWEIYNKYILSHINTYDLDFLICEYEELLECPMDVQKRIEKKCNILLDKAYLFVDKNLRHAKNIKYIWIYNYFLFIPYAIKQFFKVKFKKFFRCFSLIA